MSTLSAIIITKNEEKQITACLEALRFVDEIVVIDSESTDQTKEICQKYQAKFQVSPWLGFGKQKQLALEAASSDWILSVDADEIITKELAEEILQIVKKENLFNAYRVPRQTVFYNKALKHCCNPKKDTPIRLFKKEVANFSNDLVHEKVVTSVETGTLKNHLLHYSFKSLTDLLNKANLYSTLGVDRLSKKGIQGGMLKAFGHAFWAFIRIYLLKGGFLDGWPGFLIAFSNFEGTFYRYAKLLEMQKYR